MFRMKNAHMSKEVDSRHLLVVDIVRVRPRGPVISHQTCGAGSHTAPPNAGAIFLL